jgi:hypothetical protein
VHLSSLFFPHFPSSEAFFSLTELGPASKIKTVHRGSSRCSRRRQNTSSQTVQQLEAPLLLLGYRNAIFLQTSSSDGNLRNKVWWIEAMEASPVDYCRRRQLSRILTSNYIPFCHVGFWKDDVTLICHSVRYCLSVGLIILSLKVLCRLILPCSIPSEVC